MGREAVCAKARRLDRTRDISGIQKGLMICGVVVEEVPTRMGRKFRKVCGVLDGQVPESPFCSRVLRI